MVETSRVDGKLMAVPWFADAGLLYYRKDLLDKYKRPVPQTWADLTETARLIQEGERKEGRGDFWGYTWQGRAYEGLTTNALEWIASYNGGTIVDDKGEITIENPKAIEALKTAAGWVGTDHAPGVLNYTEEERAASSRPATPPSCATGPMPGRWRRAPTAPSRTRSASRPCRRAARTGAMPARSADNFSPCRNIRRTPQRRPISSCT